MSNPKQYPNLETDPNPEITFKKADMTFITDDELTAISIALDRYSDDLSSKNIYFRENFVNSQLTATNRMINLFKDEAGFLIVPHFPIDETI